MKKEQRFIIVKILIMLFFLFGIFLLLYVYNPESSNWMIRCAFKQFTGLSCPGCGIQRCIHSLIKGEIFHAFKYNFFLIIAFPFALTLLINNFLPDSSFKRRMDSIINNKLLVRSFFFSSCGWFIIRNILNI
ncbi:MAG: DUF2752 domain-containing protein [Prevotella sp.]|nr:DUF2752 domain-containing protein [Prevotella sp.]